MRTKPQQDHMKSILIMAAGTPADTLRLASGERIGGLWKFASRQAKVERFAEIGEVLRAHGLRLIQMPVPDLVCGDYGIGRAMAVGPELPIPS